MFVHAKSAVFDIPAEKERQVFAPFVFEARAGKDEIEHPLLGKFPAHADGGNHWPLTIDVDAEAEDPLQVRACNVRATDDDRHIKVIAANIMKVAINAGLELHAHKP